jgi:hypothetical protein
MTLKPSNFKESATSKPFVADAHESHPHPRASVDSLSPPFHGSAVRSSIPPYFTHCAYEP